MPCLILSQGRAGNSFTLCKRLKFSKFHRPVGKALMGASVNLLSIKSAGKIFIFKAGKAPLS